MLDIEARSSFSLDPLVTAWNYMEVSDTGFRGQIFNLLKQLTKSAHLMNPREFWNVCNQGNVVTALAIDRSDLLVPKVAGMAMMFIHWKFSSAIGYIEDVVVDGDYQRQGIAERLTKKLLEVGRYFKLRSINLSSNNKPERMAAHRLYLKLGFEERDSTLFRKKLL